MIMGNRKMNLTTHILNVKIVYSDTTISLTKVQKKHKVVRQFAFAVAHALIHIILPIYTNKS